MSDIYDKLPNVPRWNDNFRAGNNFAEGRSPEDLFIRGKSFIFEEALGGGRQAFFGDADVSRARVGTHKKLVEFLEKSSYRCCISWVENDDRGSVMSLFSSAVGLIYVSYRASAVPDPDSFYNDEDEDDESISSIIQEPYESIDFQAAGANKEQILRAIKIVEADQVPSPPYIHKDPGAAYVMANVPMQGIQLVKLGIAGEDLQRENYMPEVIRQYDEVILDIQRKNPFGQLTILEGEPGCGKTHMIQAFMKSCPHSKFVIVPPKLLKELEDPGFILTYAEEAIVTGHALVLILEDADQCVTKRNRDNISSISAILNLSDGIVGRLLNFRIIATTNTPISENDDDDKKKNFLDGAAIREGRLSQHIKIGALTAEQAHRAWDKIVSDNSVPTYKLNLDNMITLANVYGAAKRYLEKKNGII